MGGEAYWIELGWHACACVQDDRIVAVAFWHPAMLGEEVDDEHSSDPGKPRITEAGFYLAVVSDPARLKWFADGPEPTGDWPDELIMKAWQAYREWGVP